MLLDSAVTSVTKLPDALASALLRSDLMTDSRPSRSHQLVNQLPLQLLQQRTASASVDCGESSTAAPCATLLLQPLPLLQLCLLAQHAHARSQSSHLVADSSTDLTTMVAPSALPPVAQRILQSLKRPLLLLLAHIWTIATSLNCLLPAN